MIRMFAAVACVALDFFDRFTAAQRHVPMAQRGKSTGGGN